MGPVDIIGASGDRWVAGVDGTEATAGPGACNGRVGVRASHAASGLWPLCGFVSFFVLVVVQ